jgi:hypothetical protein
MSCQARTSPSKYSPAGEPVWIRSPNNRWTSRSGDGCGRAPASPQAAAGELLDPSPRSTICRSRGDRRQWASHRATFRRPPRSHGPPLSDGRGAPHAVECPVGEGVGEAIVSAGARELRGASHASAGHGLKDCGPRGIDPSRRRWALVGRAAGLRSDLGRPDNAGRPHAGQRARAIGSRPNRRLEVRQHSRRRGPWALALHTVRLAQPLIRPQRRPRRLMAEQRPGARTE